MKENGESNDLENDQTGAAPEGAPEEAAAAPEVEAVEGVEPADLVSEEETIELDPLALSQAEADKWRDIAARSAADLENYRKRMAREKSDAIQYANRSLLEDLLPVLDNFQMGLKAAEQSASDEAKNILLGMNMVSKQMEDFLGNHGATPVPAIGEAFDPNVHEAVKEEPSADVEEGKIIFELRRGYRMGERLLRAATVVVSSGPEKSDA